MSLERPMARIWPDGEFCLWVERKGEIFDPEQSIPLGLSKVANSHKPEGESQERVIRGLKGVTRYGQKMVRNAAYLLQKKYGGRQLAFLTVTIPGSPDDTFEVACKWAEVVRRYVQELKRMLVRKGLPGGIVGVTEIQPKRFKREGGMPLHLHLIFRAAVSDYQWAFKSSDYQVVWERVVSGVCPMMKGRSFSSSSNCQRVKESAAGYLGKYMSKGEKDIAEIIQDCPAVVEALPSSWYCITNDVRQAVLENCAYGESVGRLIESWLPRGELPLDPFRYITKIKLEDDDGRVLRVFYVGNLEGWAKKAVGLPLKPHDVVGL